MGNFKKDNSPFLCGFSLEKNFVKKLFILEFKINECIRLKLEDEKIRIYVKNEKLGNFCEKLILIVDVSEKGDFNFLITSMRLRSITKSNK
ncbi:MAG: hypothetical protein ACFE9T_14715 [Promethearchaeota archaeon]